MARRLWKSPADADDERKRSLPSWLFSLGAHVLVYVTLLLSMRSWGSGTGGLGSDRFLQVNLLASDDEPGGGGGHGFDRAAANGRGPDALPGAGDLDQPDGKPLAAAQPSEEELANAVGQSLDQLIGSLPDRSAVSESGLTAVDGASAKGLTLPPSVGSTSLLEGLAGRGGQGGQGTNGGFGTGGLGTGNAGVGAGNGDGAGRGGAGGGRRGTSFFEIPAQGSRFVYVIDHSGSMATYNQLPAAKAELWASLQSLDAAQQFHVIFYDDNLREFRLSSGKPSLVWANEINKGLARQFLAEVQPDGGTNHLLALEAAIRLRPDHIFLLTDADEPQMTEAQRRKIKQSNGGRSQIHCVEFGKGGDLGAPTFLKQLAKDNGGTYRYRDITKL